MKSDEILQYCIENLEGTILTESWGEKGIFYNPGHLLKRGVYVLTIKEKDGDNDKGSNLDRADVYRVNMGIRKDTFIERFNIIPKRPKAGQIVEMNCDFTCFNKIIPHPVYAWMGWISVLNPSLETFEELKPLIQESYEYAIEKFQKRKKL